MQADEEKGKAGMKLVIKKRNYFISYFFRN